MLRQYFHVHFQKNYQMLFLLGFCLVLYFVNLGQWDLWNPDEPRYAQVAKEMVKGGDWILMHRNGEVYTDKPPLFFWAIALSSFLWGGFHSFSARFPSAFFGSLAVLLTFFLGQRLYSSRAGFLSALILATNAEFAYLSTRGNIDTTLTFFTAASMLSFVRWYSFGSEEETSRTAMKGLTFFGFYGGMAFATLAKGPVGILLPLLVTLVYLLIQRDWRAIRRMRLLPGLLLFVAIVSVWYVPAILKGGISYLEMTLLHHSVERYAQGTAHVRSSFYYFYNFPLHFMPWIFFLPSAAIYGFSKQAISYRKVFIFLLVWFAVIFVFFTLSKGKRAIYLLPLYPAAALMIGKLWDDVISDSPEKVQGKLISWPLHGLAGSALLGALAIPWIIWTRFPAYLSYTFPISFLMIGGGLTGFFLHRLRRHVAIFFLTVGIFAGGFCYMLRVVFPVVNPIKSTRFISQQIASRIQPGDRVGTWGGLESSPYNYYTGIVPIWELEAETDFAQFMSSKQRVFCLVKIKRISNHKEVLKRLHAKVIAVREVGDDSILLVSNRNDLGGDR